MPTGGFPRSPRLFKGALVELKEQFLGLETIVIPFQYNPQSFTRNLEAFQKPEDETGKGPTTETNDRAQPFDPEETFSLTLELDASDALEENDRLAVRVGVADRIAALERLLYPQESELEVGGLLGPISVSLSVSIGGASSGSAQVLEKRQVPVILFVWGAGRTLPVRLTSFSVEEQFFSPKLHPIHAKVTIGLKVLTHKQLGKQSSPAVELAKQAYENALRQKRVLAKLNESNLSSAVDSILAMIPI